MSTRSIRIEKTKVKTLDVVLITMTFMVFITAVVWLALFLNFGKNIESYRESLMNSQRKIQGTEQKIAQLNDEIAKAVQLLNSYEGK